jgi:hypothetical protein
MRTDSSLFLPHPHPHPQFQIVDASLVIKKLFNSSPPPPPIHHHLPRDPVTRRLHFGLNWLASSASVSGFMKSEFIPGEFVLLFK